MEYKLKEKIVRPFYSSIIANIFFSLMPTSRLFATKRKAMRLLGFTVGEGVRFGAELKFFGRGHISFGSKTWVGSRVTFYNASSRIVIGECCDVSNEVVFHTGSHVIGDKTRRAGSGFSNQIEVGNGVWVGCRATFIAGSIVSNSSIVGACTLVNNKNLVASSLIVGVPARIVRYLDT